MLSRRSSGFSLIELMVTLTVLALILMAAAPGFGAWMANARVRTVAEELQNALRLAQAEAVRRNRQVVFALTDETPGLSAEPSEDGSYWYVQALPLVAGEAVDETFFVQGGGSAAQGGVSITGPALLCFNSLGRQVANTSTGLGADCNVPAGAAPTTYEVTHPGADRALRVEVFIGGRVRMCDPSREIATQPDGCSP